MGRENESRPDLQSDKLLELRQIIKRIALTRDNSPANMIARYQMNKLLSGKKKEQG